MKTTFSLLFYLKRPKNYENGPMPIYLRITVNGKRAETTSGRECLPAHWNNTTGRFRGTKEEVRSLNAYLDNLQTQVYDAHKILTESGATITAELIKNKLLGKSEKAKMLIAVFKDHNKKVAALVGNEYAAGTVTRYETSLRHTQSFMEWKYQVADIDVKAVDHDFISNYEFYLRSEKKCANNSAVKYIKNFKKIIRICLASGWLEKDPFVNYKAKVKQVDRIFLNADQIRQISEKAFYTDRLNQVRDIFLFCCFTGLAYADVQKLKQSEIIKGADGEMWIVTKRLKTNTPTKVPLLPAALTILEKYSNDPFCIIKGKALPVSTNQKMNAYLKEIAGVCGINKDLTFHIARHTFATTVTLSNGVPIETVSKMLGHTNIKTTQHYAKILDLKVSRDMALLKEKYKAGAF
ncbi:site-specific integrase [Mucilaginibacter sp. BJC16-A38]|uniref:site-specific integrase n=1 Tax=Mucilaginibacter phenanthrenivorans TaxID=1234842 RepID=UPI0021571779|nr:site-specific integrase [Mucilaginibacter phenanthrenivorans]MCR8558866.1 site-specific integrase [Mucilaginibacter phenanthrenivorans]